ncbi:MAG: hypothetical protein IKY24_01925 [Alistipes sp.]|nr:hypothetical protein [Alistipes sp.]
MASSEFRLSIDSLLQEQRLSTAAAAMTEVKNLFIIVSSFCFLKIIEELSGDAVGKIDSKSEPSNMYLVIFIYKSLTCWKPTN